MATLVWTGAVSNVFFSTENWNLPGFPENGDAIVIAPVSGAPTPVFAFGPIFDFVSLSVSSNFLISGTVEFFVAGSFTIGGGTTRIVDSASFIAGSMLVNGALDIDSNVYSGVSGLAIGATGAVYNHSNFNVGGGPAPSAGATKGDFYNYGTLTLNGTIDADISNSGTFVIDGQGVTESLFQSHTGSLSVRGQYVVNQTTFLAGDLTVFKVNDIFSTGRIESMGDVTLQLDTLTVDVSGFEGLDQSTAGTPSTELTLVSAIGLGKVINGFSASQTVVQGAHSDFSYALRLSGSDTSASPNALSLRALNSAATGGAGVLNQVNANNAITAVFDGAQDRGTIRGGEFWFNADNLLIGVDEIVGTAFADSMVVTSGVRTYTFRGAAGSDTLSGAGGMDSLFGEDGSDSLTGNAGADSLVGGMENDTLNGGAGLDRMLGGAGDDLYFVDATGDIVTEALGEGLDVVTSSASFTLAANVETLTLTGTLAINGTGNSLANTLTGNAAANILNGGTGVDRLVGGAGNDIFVTDGGDTIVELASGGTDTVQSSAALTLGANLEHLILTGTASIAGTGNTLANRITGNGGNNLLNGGLGADTLTGGAGRDTLIGGAGNDVFYVDATNDVVTEAAGGGLDLVYSSASFTLSANVETLTLTGALAINGTGNSLANTLNGNAAANILNGGTGVDRLVGGAGNDIFVTDGGDTIVELASGGTDTVQSSAALTLGANLEHLILTGTASIAGTGNTLANRITGNGGNNLMNGGLGADTLTGGAGSDTLTGGSGIDDFVFSNGSGADRITDFIATGTSSDNLDFRASTQIISFADLKANHMRAVGTNVEIKAGTDVVLLLNVRLADLDAGDFMF